MDKVFNNIIDAAHEATDKLGVSVQPLLRVHHESLRQHRRVQLIGEGPMYS